MSKESENAAVKRTLESSYCPALIKEARDEQDTMLRERLRGGSFNMADIGCGNGYHAVEFAPKLYHGFEISPDIAETARVLWRAESIDYAEVFVRDVTEVDLQNELYDVVLCLYFTPGNFRAKSDDLSLFSDVYLDRNPEFIQVFSRFYRAMKPGGAMFLTIYQDVPEAEAAQVDYYENTGQHVVTQPGSRFVATAEGFWSVRWTEDSMLSNLDACGMDSHNVEFHKLNGIAWLVEIRK